MAALDQLEVQRRLDSYDSKQVTDNLYDMGKTLMDESSQRIDYLDGKTARIAGYTGAIIGLMVSTFPIWTSAVDRWGVLLVALGTSIGMVGGTIALRSMRPAKLALPSDSDWLELDGLNDPDRLKKYYISSMHLAIASQEKVNARKTWAIKSAQFCLALMVLSLFIALGNATYKVATRASSQQSSGRAALAVSSDSARYLQSNPASKVSET